MDFGICVLPRPDTCAREAQLAESVGFSHIWIADTQLMAGEAFVCLALAACTLVCSAPLRYALWAGEMNSGTGA